MLKVSVDKINDLFRAIAATQKLFLPVDTNAGAQYREWSEGVTMSQALNTNRSAKDFFFPQTENLAEFKVEGKKIEVKPQVNEYEDFVVFGVRACDAASFAILDRVFLSEPVDTFYEHRRTHGTIVTLACNRPAETCFCTTFGIDPAVPGGDVSAWQMGDALYLEAQNEKGQKLLDAVNAELSEAPADAAEPVKAAIRVMMEKLPLANLSLKGIEDQKMLDLFYSDKWKGLSESCLGCGTCTFVCPTCQCYDVRDFDTGNGIQRFRCWDSCMYSDFTRMAHGNIRNSQMERFRQRFMHKLVYFPENNEGIYSCVGCGRCLAKCPIHMNIVKVIKTMGGTENE